MFEEPNCQASGTLQTRYEMYALNANSPNPAANLDNFDKDNILSEGEDALNLNQKTNYTQLTAQMQKALAGEPACLGDGNMDYSVDQKDLDEWAFWQQETNGKSSWYDINLDGLTDEDDRTIIENNLGVTCVLPDSSDPNH